MVIAPYARLKHLKFLTILGLSSILTCGLPTSAYSKTVSPAETLKETARELFNAPPEEHPEYRDCITNAVDACGSWNADYVKPHPHGPSLTDTLDWIGTQLTSRKLAYQFHHQGCLVAIDAMKGSPLKITWEEKKDGKLEQKQRSIFTSPLMTGADAGLLMGNGYTSYFSEHHRENGTPNHPQRLSFYNDAAYFDLSKLREIKNYIGTKANGELFFVHFPTNALKINFSFDTGDKINFVGASFPGTPPDFSRGPEPFKGTNTQKTMFGHTYTPFKTLTVPHQYLLMFPNGDLDLNLKITKAFLHAISLCEVH